MRGNSSSNSTEILSLPVSIPLWVEGLLSEDFEEHVSIAPLGTLRSSRSNKPSFRRNSVVEFIVDGESEEKLKILCYISTKLWNEVNYARRKQFYEGRGVNLKGTYRELYEKYKTLIGSATAQQILNKNNEAWKSFFKLLRDKKEGEATAGSEG